jgi:hypothetical protein
LIKEKSTITRPTDNELKRRVVRVCVCVVVEVEVVVGIECILALG